uniref:Uncharacterized protein n=1 Tax=Timema monikensis TaxID=170555 RepID=A0A7R9E2H4_9NEOP|nr:unnamed protein product [Timema monikensis]
MLVVTTRLLDATSDWHISDIVLGLWGSDGKSLPVILFCLFEFMSLSCNLGHLSSNAGGHVSLLGHRQLSQIPLPAPAAPQDKPATVLPLTAPPVGVPPPTSEATLPGLNEALLRVPPFGLPPQLQQQQVHNMAMPPPINQDDSSMDIDMIEDQKTNNEQPQQIQPGSDRDKDRRPRDRDRDRDWREGGGDRNRPAEQTQVISPWIKVPQQVVSDKPSLLDRLRNLANDVCTPTNREERPPRRDRSRSADGSNDRDEGTSKKLPPPLSQEVQDRVPSEVHLPRPTGIPPLFPGPGPRGPPPGTGADQLMTYTSNKSHKVSRSPGIKQCDVDPPRGCDCLPLTAREQFKANIMHINKLGHKSLSHTNNAVWDSQRHKSHTQALAPTHLHSQSNTEYNNVDPSSIHVAPLLKDFIHRVLHQGPVGSVHLDQHNLDPEAHRPTEKILIHSEIGNEKGLVLQKILTLEIQTECADQGSPFLMNSILGWKDFPQDSLFQMNSTHEWNHFLPRGPPHPDDFDILPLGPEDFDNRERHPDDFDRRAMHEEEFDRRNRRPDGFELRGPPRDGFDPRLPHPEEFDLRDPRLDGFDPRGRGPGPDFFPREGFGPMGMMGPRGPGMGPEGFGPRHFMGPRGPGPMFHPRGPPGPMGMRGPRPGVWIDGQAPPGVFPLFEGPHPPDGGPPDSFFGRPPFDEERRGRDRGGWEHRGPRRGGPPGREEGGRFPRRREEINPRGNRRDEDDKEPRGDRERKSRWSNASPVVEGTESVDTSHEEKEEPLELGAGPPIEGEVSIEADTPKEPEQGPELEFQDSQGDSTPCNDELELAVLEPIEAPEAVEAEPTPISECAPPVEETAE